MRKLVSIIIPIYNVKTYLRKCISSVINQTLQDIEVILVDDGSTDGSESICDEFSVKDSRITVIHQTNKGLVNARKQGIKAAEGEYIGFVDGDDYISPTMFEKLFAYIEECKADFIHSGYFENEKYVGTDVSYTVRLDERTRENILGELIEGKPEVLRGVTPSIWSKLFKRSIVENAYFSVPDNQPFGEDLLCLIKSIMIADSIGFLNEAYYYYNHRVNSLSHDTSIRDRIKKITGLCDCVEELIRTEGWYNNVEKYIDSFAFGRMTDLIQEKTGRINIQRYRFKGLENLGNKRIVLYGAGVVGIDYYSQISRYDKCRIIAWVDRNYASCHFDFREVEDPGVIPSIDYDLIIIAQLYQRVAEEITVLLRQMGVAENRIVWVKPEIIF